VTKNKIYKLQLINLISKTMTLLESVT